MMSTNRPTIKDIAKIAGVSHVTVSQALRDMPCISENTRIRIKKIAKDLGYTPNLTARNLASKNPTSIGMIVPALGSETAYNEIINSLSVLVEKDNLCLLLGSSNRKIDLEKSYCRLMYENMVGALIIASSTSDVTHIKKICNGLVPIIFIGGKTGEEEENYILPDYYESGKLAVGHLHSLGHTKIGIFLYPPENKTILSKLHGYLDAVKNLALPPLVFWNGCHTDTFHSGYTLTEELLSRNELPSAIWCASDLMAYGVIEALKKHNISIGTEVSVMGHDNLFFSSVPSNSLTTIALPKEEIAENAMLFAKQLMAYNQNPSLPKPNCKLKLQNKLIVRNSTGRLQ